MLAELHLEDQVKIVVHVIGKQVASIETQEKVPIVEGSIVD